MFYPNFLRGKSMRRCRVLLAFLLVPLMITLTGSAARAAPGYGDAASVSFAPATEYGTGIDCSLSAFFSINGTTLAVEVRGASCSSSFNVSSADMDLLSVNGDNCSFSGALGQMDGTGTVSTTLTASGFNGDPSTCVVTELCYGMNISSHSNPFQDDYRSGCVPFALGSPPEPVSDGTCAYGTPSLPSTFTPAQTRSDTYWRNTVNIAATPGPNTNTGPNVWHLYAIIAQPGMGPNGLGMPRMFTTPTTLTSGPVSIFHDIEWYDGSKKNAAIVGWGMAHDTLWNTSRAGQVSRTPQQGGGGVQGVHNPSDCLWYFGPKIAEVANSDIDEPGGPVTGPSGGGSPTEPVVDPPDPTPPDGAGCAGFSFTDPGSWASAGVCAVVRTLMWLGDRLGAALDAIAALLGGIVEAVLDGLSALFIPAPGFFDSKVDSLKADMNETAPVAYVDAVTGQTWDMPGSSCGGIPVAWSAGGKSFSFDLGASCSGPMATASTVVRLGASAFLLIFGGLGCIRALGSGFGWSPTIGRGDSA